MSVESTRAWRKRHPEKLTADARRSARKISDEMYQATAAYQKSREKYIHSGKKRISDANGYLRHAYGKTVADKRAQYEKQKGICSLCGLALPEDALACHWDHDHTTGRMRDILHKYCNQMLGWIENDLHEKALSYLERQSNVQS